MHRIRRNRIRLAAANRESCCWPDAISQNVLWRSLPFAASGGAGEPIWIEPIGHSAFGVAGDPGEMAIDVVAGRKMPGHHRSPAGRANSAGYGEAVEICAFGSESINVWRFHIRMTMTTQVTPSPVIGENEKNVGLWCRDQILGNPQTGAIQ